MARTRHALSSRVDLVALVVLTAAVWTLPTLVPRAPADDDGAAFIGRALPLRELERGQPVGEQPLRLMADRPLLAAFVRHDSVPSMRALLALGHAAGLAAERRPSEQGVAVAVVFDGSTGAVPDGIVSYVGLHCPAVADSDGSLTSAFGVRRVPTVLLIGVDGTCVGAAVGYDSDLPARLLRWLREPRSG